MCKMNTNLMLLALGIWSLCCAAQYTGASANYMAEINSDGKTNTLRYTRRGIKTLNEKQSSGGKQRRAVHILNEGIYLDSNSTHACIRTKKVNFCTLKKSKRT